MHGDLKPVGDFPSFVATSSELYLQTNILIDDDENVQLADFGLSRLIVDMGTFQTMTSGAHTNYQWAAPELIEPSYFDLTSSRPTRFTDVYSLACSCIEVSIAS